MIRGKLLQACQIMTFAAKRRAEDIGILGKSLNGQEGIGRFLSVDIRKSYTGGNRKYENVLQTLSSSGFLASKRGPRGGFWIVDKGANAKVLDLARVVSPPDDYHAIEICSERLKQLTPKDVVLLIEDLNAANADHLAA